MATHKISYVAGEESTLDTTSGMAVVVGAAATGDLDVTIDQAAIGRDAAIAGLEKVIVLLRDNSFPMA